VRIYDIAGLICSYDPQECLGMVGIFKGRRANAVHGPRSGWPAIVTSVVARKRLD
jgi:hypothetical protein